MRPNRLVHALFALLPAVAALTTRDTDSTDSGRSAQVVILGGGIAGISVARTLAHEYNITDFILIEGRDELGGRAHTVQLVGPDGVNRTVEKGCNWIQGPGKEAIQELADKWGLQSTPTNYTDIVFFEGKWGVEGNASAPRGSFLTDDQVLAFTEGYDNFIDNAPGYSDWRTNNSLVDISVRVATSILDWIPVDPMQMLYEYWNVDFTFAQPPEDSSFANAFGQEAGIADSADRFVTDERGYKYVFVQEAKEVFGQDLSDPRLRLGTTVRTVDYTDDTRVRVETDKGDFYASRFVVSTFSVGVLQHQDVHWEPRLPDWKKEAIFSFNMATYQKIFLLFPTQFWGDTEFILYGDPEQRGRYAVWQNINAPGYIPQNTSTNVIMVTAVDDMARSNEKRTDAEIQAEAMQVLREMYGEDIPPPDDIIVPRWNSDPLYRGSYSNWPLGVLDQHHENLRQPVGHGRVLFTGEAMSPEAFGYVQGAWLEGESTGRGIGECIVHGNCPEVEIYEALTTCAQVSSEEAFKRKRSMSRIPRRSHNPGAARWRR